MPDRPSVGAFDEQAQATAPGDPVAVLSRQVTLLSEQNSDLIHQNHRLGAELRETREALARVYVSADGLRNALRDLHAAGGGE